MKKGLLIVGIVILVLVVGLGSAYLIATGSSTVKAQLVVDDGAVSVNGNPVSGNTKLSEGDVIATGDGHASVILYESVILNLEQNSQVTLDSLVKEHPVVSQQSGRTWNTFTKLLGVESYSIKEGNNVASVRGTGFEFAEGFMLTGEGSVSYDADGMTFIVNAGRVVEAGMERDATAEELASVKEHVAQTIQTLRFLRQQELDKHPTLVSLAKSTYGLDDAEIAQKFEEADRGEIDIDDAVAKSPMQFDSLNKIADITKEIQKLSAYG